MWESPIDVFLSDGPVSGTILEVHPRDGVGVVPGVDVMWCGEMRMVRCLEQYRSNESMVGRPRVTAKNKSGTAMAGC